MRIKKIPRESACIVILRRKGQSINNISKFLGRSTSYIQRILKFNGLRADLRKLPMAIKLKSASRQRIFMEKTRFAWEQWIFSDSGERPP